MASELTIADAWMYAQLTGDATLVAAATGGIHNTQPPQGTNPPYVVFQFIGGLHLNAGRGTRAGTQLDYDVSGYTEGSSFVVADTMAERIDAVLSAIAPVDAPGGYTGAQLTSAAIAPLGQVPNPLGGIRTNRRGHQVRVTVRRTA